MLSDQSLLRSVKWQLLVLDEAQAIKNPESLRSKAVRTIDREVSIAVTGTPVENHIEEIWSILDFVLPGLFGDLATFQSRFENSVVGATLLAPLIEPLLLRRRVKDVAKDLPELIEIEQVLPMDTALTARYLEVMSDIKERKMQPLQGVLRLRMLACHAEFPDDFCQSFKAQRLREIFDEISPAHEKLLIFTAYTKSIDAINDFVMTNYPKHMIGIIDGRLPPSDRQYLIDEFSAFEGSAVLILNPRAGGIGLNITAANHVIHFGPEWNPAVTDQASRRAFRRGQSMPVTVHHFAYVDSVEERIMKRSSTRRQIAEIVAPGSSDEPTIADLTLLLGKSSL